MAKAVDTLHNFESLDDLKDDDFCLDLDSDNDVDDGIAAAESAFKRPLDIVAWSPRSSTKTVAFSPPQASAKPSLDNDDDDDDDELDDQFLSQIAGEFERNQSKHPAASASAAVAASSSSLSDEEDEFIKSQTVYFTSTQRTCADQATHRPQAPTKSSSSNNNTNINNMIKPVTPISQRTAAACKSIIISTQSPAEIMKQKTLKSAASSNSNSNSNTSSNTSSNNNTLFGNNSNNNKSRSPADTGVDLSAEVGKECWILAQGELAHTFSALRMAGNLMARINVEYYFKKFFEYDFLMRTTEESVRKVPILCVCIKEIERKAHCATALLTDGTERVKATIANSLVAHYWHMFSVGSVIWLQDVCCLRVNFNKNGYHVNINAHNLLRVYYKEASVEDGDECQAANTNASVGVNHFELNALDADKLRKLYDEFEKKFVHLSNFDFSICNSSSSSSKQNTSTATNAGGGGVVASKAKAATMNASKSASSISSVRKPAPYTVPNPSARITANATTATTTTTTTTRNNPPQKAFSFTIGQQQQQQQPQQQQTVQSNTASTSVRAANCQPVTSATSVQRPEQQQQPNEQQQHQPFVESNIRRGNVQLSEEVLSQLIFGVDDDDDD